MNYILLKRKKSNTVWSMYRIVSGPVPRDDNDQIYCMEIEPSAINTKTLFQWLWKQGKFFSSNDIIGVLMSDGLVMRVKLDNAKERARAFPSQMTPQELHVWENAPDYIQVQFLRDKMERLDKTLERLRAHLAKQNDSHCFEALLEISAWLEEHKPEAVMVSGNQTG